MQYSKQGLLMLEGIMPCTIKPDKRITKKLLKEVKPVIRKPSPLEEALKYAEVLKEPSVVSKTQVGERFGVSRAHVCQILNLLDLDFSIQEYLLSIENVKEHNYFTERRLRQIAVVKDNHAQLRKFGKLLQDMKLKLNYDF
ncbi:hypothetical protein ACFL60_08800 [Candidatus Omnitrophota bacterium]